MTKPKYDTMSNIMKQQISVRLSDETLTLRAALARKLGITETGVLEMAVRRLADAEGVKLDQLRTASKPKRAKVPK